MKIKDIKIGTQLKIGFGVIIILILILSAISWQQTDKITAQATDMYNHPLKVRRALGELKSDILYIRLGMKELILAENNEEVASILQVIEKYKDHAFAQFEVMSTLYLGPPEDIESAYSDFLKWNTIRDETIRLRREGKVEEATVRSKLGGVGVNQVEELLSHFLKIDNFAVFEMFGPPGDGYLQFIQCREAGATPGNPLTNTGKGFRHRLVGKNENTADVQNAAHAFERCAQKIVQIVNGYGLLRNTGKHFFICDALFQFFICLHG